MKPGALVILYSAIFFGVGFAAGWTAGPVANYWEQYESAELMALRLADCKADLQIMGAK